jgi:2-polyprenyl-3-methyl-5-hydroxy-6-metoxy-1,4-benzoquinol methylase
MNCPLCKTDEVATIELVSVKDIKSLYLRSIGLDIGHLFSDEGIRFKHCKKCDLKYFDPPITGDEAFYRALQECDWYYLQEKEEYNYASQFIQESDSVLDIGCGKAAFAHIIKSRHYTGIDFSRNAKEIAESRGIKIENATIQDHAGTNKQGYTVVCGFQILEHVADASGFIQSSLDCLSPGGLLIYSVPSDDGYLAAATNSITNIPPHHVTRWSDKALRSIASEFLLEIVDIYHESLSDIHRAFYLATILSSRLRRIFGIENHVLDMTLRNRLIVKLAFLATRAMPSRFLAASKQNGHTVTIVLRKRLFKTI